MKLFAALVSDCRGRKGSRSRGISSAKHTRSALAPAGLHCFVYEPLVFICWVHICNNSSTSSASTTFFSHGSLDSSLSGSTFTVDSCRGGSLYCGSSSTTSTSTGIGCVVDAAETSRPLRPREKIGIVFWRLEDFSSQVDMDVGGCPAGASRSKERRCNKQCFL